MGFVIRRTAAGDKIDARGIGPLKADGVSRALLARYPGSQPEAEAMAFGGGVQHPARGEAVADQMRLDAELPQGSGQSVVGDPRRGEGQEREVADGPALAGVDLPEHHLAFVEPRI